MFREDDVIKLSTTNMPFAIHAWQKYAPKNLVTDIKKLILKEDAKYNP